MNEIHFFCNTSNQIKSNWNCFWEISSFQKKKYRLINFLSYSTYNLFNSFSAILYVDDASCGIIYFHGI